MVLQQKSFSAIGALTIGALTIGIFLAGMKSTGIQRELFGYVEISDPGF
ncbi:MAG: hypothetical protein L3J69_00225 [Desulfobacula sp.]|nr:hypothetical protein [Desulfobacula sp.]